MLILGIETATAQVGCAIGGHEGVLAEFHSARGRRHVETLAPAIEFVCRQARVELSEISAVAVDIGPGLFSGLRVGVATAKAMAQALRVPTVGVSSLDLLAFPMRYSSRLIAAVIDARRGEVFYAFYRQVPGGPSGCRPTSWARPTSWRRSCWPGARSASSSATAPSATRTCFARSPASTPPTS